MKGFVTDRRVARTTPHLYVDGDLWVSRASTVGVLGAGDLEWSNRWALPVHFRAATAGRIRLVERALRLGCATMGRTGRATVLVVADRQIFRSEEGDGLVPVHRLTRGSRLPHRGLCTTSGAVVWGEYFGNAGREAVRVFASADDGRSFLPVYEFAPGAVRHVHGIQQDPHDGMLWIMTGDDGDEAAIYRSDPGFAAVERVGGGTQDWRCLSLLFSPTHVYWGSDSPDAASHILRWDRTSGKLERLQGVGGPVYYSGRNEAGMMFFATTVEPGSHAGPNAELWFSEAGDEFRLLGAFPKDRWHPTAFQFGVITFPDGTMPANTLVFSGTALRGIENTLVKGRIVGEGDAELSR